MTTGNTLVGKRDTAAGPETRPGKTRTRLWLLLLLVCLAVLAAIGIAIRLSRHATLAARTKEDAVPSVSIVKATAGPMNDDLNLPGTLQAFVDAPLYARTDGYLKAWYFDIGARVKKGQLIAVIETPELDQQLDQARAAVNTARANYDLAVVTNKRYQALVATAAVSKQEADQSASNQAAQKANVDQAVSNVRRYEAMQAFERIYAPFDGIVTERNTDIGQLVSSGITGGSGTAASSTGASATGVTGRELFRVSAMDRLRTFVPVPQSQSPYVSVGQTADLHLIERPGRTFPAVVARTAGQIDNASRTLLTEVDIDNHNGELLPGAYVDVHLQLPGNGHDGAVRVPANVLIFRGHDMQIAVVGDDNKVHLRPVQIGRDFGNSVELVSGITDADRLVVNPPDSLADGQQVKIAPEPNAPATASQSSGDKKKDSGDDSDNSGKPGSGKAKASPKAQDIQPSRGSTDGVAKGSRRPEDKNAKAKGQGIDTNNRYGSRDDVNGTRPKQDRQKSGDEPDSGMTAPGSDGNGAK